MGGPCCVCEAMAHLSCGGCGGVHYCGKEHQRQHWPQHRQQCQPFRVVSSEAAGRYLVSSRQLTTGQVLMEDIPLVVAPMAVSEGVCLGCHERIPESVEVVRCSGCQWPLCSLQCATSPNHLPECDVLARDTNHITPPLNLETTPRYELIMILRCLLLRDRAPSAWKEVMSMAHHTEQRLAGQEEEELHVIRVSVREVLKLDYSEDVINQVVGAVATNTLEIRTGGHNAIRALYPRVRLFNHSCVPNVHLSSATNGRMQVRAAVNVGAGELLSISYTGTMIPVWERQSTLSNNYYFTCECVRCRDPTELGTHFSSPRCPECAGCFLEPTRWLGDVSWICPTCHLEEKDAKVQAEVSDWMSRLQMDDILGSSGSPYKRVVALLSQVEMDYHPTHFIWMKVAQASLYRLRDDNSLRALKLRRRLWQQLADLYMRLEPGETRRRGMSLMEMGSLRLLEAKTEYAEGNTYLPAFLDGLRELVDTLKTAVRTLDQDNPGSVGKAMVAIVQKKVAEAQQFLDSLTPEVTRSE